MSDHEEEEDSHRSEDHEEDDLDSDDGEVSDDRRDDKGKSEKNKSDEYRPKIDEDHRRVETSGDSDIFYRHPRRGDE